MEKRKAHYSLPEVKAFVARLGIGAFTATALQGLDQMGLSPAEGLAVVLGLQSEMLFKSMTTYVDSRIWQDVYHAHCPNGKTAYIKITLRPWTVVIQFKEL
ncbi:type II toxin-antitoxin system MqsR family toxin [Acidithiobacillus sp. MC6.1]|nr:type II toxin-antitoxin system MqsR family toxin [Acidithiobacillus sp. MC6.1]